MTTMKDFLIINNSGSDQIIADLGIIIPDATSVSSFDLSDQFGYYRIYGSDDLRDLVSAGTFTLNDGTTDLTPSEGVDYLNSVNLYELETDYYSKTELETSGQSSVHWDNITDKPDSDTVLIDGILYVNDSTRGLYLSVERHSLIFGDVRNAKNRFLNVEAGNIVSYNSGSRFIRNACLVGISAQLSQSGTCDILIYKNKILTTIASLSISASTGNEDGTLNVNIDQGDYLQAYVSNTQNVKNPVVTLQYAWR